MRRLTLMAIAAVVAIAGLASMATAAQAWPGAYPDRSDDYVVTDGTHNNPCPQLNAALNGTGGCVVPMSNMQPMVLIGQYACPITFDLRFAASGGWVWATNIRFQAGVPNGNCILEPGPNAVVNNSNAWHGVFRPVGAGEFEVRLYATYYYRGAGTYRAHAEVHTLRISHNSSLNGMGLTNTLTAADETSEWVGFSEWWTGHDNNPGRYFLGGQWASAQDVIIEPS